jgi:tRNA modification GTPase
LVIAVLAGLIAMASSTIFALATPPQPATCALVRICGPNAAIVSKSLMAAPWARGSHRGTLDLRVGPTPCIAWLQPAPATLTGEDTLELLLPGHPEILRDLGDHLRAMGVRDAEPGEFTRRAVESGRMDLSQAEATLALVTASDEIARRQAIADLAGESAQRIRGIAERLRAISARYEMSFDFSEEEHAQAEEARLAADLGALVDDLRTVVGHEPLHSRRETPEIVLFGPPNAGKSSLLNALAGRHRVLVSEVPGTTRDAVEYAMDFGGRGAKLVDLSGVGRLDADRGRFATAARERAARADILLVLSAPGQEHDCHGEFAALGNRDPSLRSRAIWVHTMGDLRGSPRTNPPALTEVTVSAASGAGLDELRGLLGELVAELASGGVTSLLRRKARYALELLEAATGDDKAPPEAVAGEVRRALTALDEALLADAPGDVLDLIFSRFCIGK